MLSTIAEIQKGQGLGSGYEWLAGLVSRVCMAGLVFRVCMGGPNISGVQISRDRLQAINILKGCKYTDGAGGRAQDINARLLIRPL